MLREAVAVIIAHHGEAVEEWVEQEYISRAAGQAVGGTDWERIFKPYFGRCITQGEASISGMCRLFH